MREIDRFYLEKDEPNRGCLLALREIILEQDDELSESKKYGMPCFSYKKKAFCYLWVDRKSNEPYILFVEGKYLDHPELEIGDRSRMKIFRINPSIDLPIKTVQVLLDQALKLYEEEVIEIKKS